MSAFRDFAELIKRRSQDPGEILAEEERAYISSGSIALDWALGGGFRLGEVAEVFGPESSGKTAVAYHAVRGAQRAGLCATIVDPDWRFDPAAAARYGVDLESLDLAQPDDGEGAIAAVLDQLEAGVSLVVLETLASLVTPEELAGAGGPRGESYVALVADAAARFQAAAARKGAAVILVNEVRRNFRRRILGSRETSPGGKTMKATVDVRLELRRTETLMEAGRAWGARVHGRVLKGGMERLFREADVTIRGEGISHRHEVFDLAAERGYIVRRGVRYLIAGTSIELGTSYEEAVGQLAGRPSLFVEVEQRLLAALFPGGGACPVAGV